MRIISGKFKGKKLFLPKDIFTRPLKDLTKESIFNIISHSNLLNQNIENSNILDMFSGIGSFGLECLSRGAKSATFVENYKNALSILKQNIKFLNLSKKTEIFTHDILKIQSYDFIKKKFDIIFLDPPYKETKVYNLIEKILKNNLLKKEGIIIIHRHKKDNDLFPKNFNVLKEVNYGISKIIFGK